MSKEKPMVLLPVMKQASIVPVGVINGLEPDGSPKSETLFGGTYQDIADFASLMVQKERVVILKMLDEAGIKLTQEQVEAISDRKEEW